MNDTAKEQIKLELTDLGIEAGKIAIDKIFNIISIVVEDSENKIDDAFLPLLLQIKPLVLKYLESKTSND